MTQYDYLLEQPVKMEINYEDMTLNYFLPESSDLKFPIKVTYRIFDEKGNAALKIDLIQNAKFYNKKMIELIRQERLIKSIGDIDFTNFYDFNRNIAYAFNRSMSIFEGFDSEIEEFAKRRKIDINSEVLLPFYILKDTISGQLSDLKKLLPSSLICCFINEETGEIVKAC